jgi:hypothetical protein
LAEDKEMKLEKDVKDTNQSKLTNTSLKWCNGELTEV